MGWAVCQWAECQSTWLGTVSMSWRSKDWAGLDVKGMGWARCQWARCQRTEPDQVSRSRSGVNGWMSKDWPGLGVNGLKRTGTGPGWVSIGRAGCQWAGPGWAVCQWAGLDVNGLGVNGPSQESMHHVSMGWAIFEWAGMGVNGLGVKGPVNGLGRAGCQRTGLGRASMG